MKFALIAAAALTLAAAPAARAQAPAAVPAAAAALTLMSKDLIAGPNKEVRVLELTSPPGAASMAHRHNGQVFVYVLSGAMVMQVAGQAPVTVGPGQMFYENPADVHLMSRNASTTQPARFLAIMILDKGAPVSIPVN
jgi:quercetin dioxygenase-like cupin family protein